MQCVIPKATSRVSVACAMRPKPRKPAVRVGRCGVAPSWVPQKTKGDQGVRGHCGCGLASGGQRA